MLLSWRLPTTAASLSWPSWPSWPPWPRPFSSSPLLAGSDTARDRAYCSLRFSSEEQLELQPQPSLPQQPEHIEGYQGGGGAEEEEEDDDDDDDEEEKGEEEIPGIQVPRQRHISVSKSELLNAVVSYLFQSQEQDAIDQFLLLSSCLDSILHAEHKSTLEQMRNDYSQTVVCKNQATPNDCLRSSGWKSRSTKDSKAENGTMEQHENDMTGADQHNPFNSGINSRHLEHAPKSAREIISAQEFRFVCAARFQRAFMHLLNSAQFEELSARDLMLTSVLNTNYLLNLPIYVDWKRASQSHTIIFRRGYATQEQKGLLIVEKLDYIQSKILQRIFSITLKPLVKALRSALRTQEVQDWIERTELFIKTLPFLRLTYWYSEQTSKETCKADQLPEDDLPIWLAAQRAIASYEGFLSPVGPRGRLIRRFLTWVGLIPSTKDTQFGLEDEHTTSEPHLRPSFLPRISLGDIWRPAAKKRDDVWSWLKISVSILLSDSVLQEPAFEELILLYTEEVSDKESEDPFLRLKIYEKIPIPELPVMFPHKKLSFRIIDTIRLDVTSVVGLLAFFLNNKFEDILSSPSAPRLDVIAVGALAFYVARVVLGYKQTWDRYNLLVDKTLYEKTLASGFGAVHFLLDASEQEQYKEAILAYAIMHTMENEQVTCERSLADRCERFMYEVFKQKVEMPMVNTMHTLTRLGLVSKFGSGEKIKLQATPLHDAYKSLQKRWNTLLHS